MAPTPNPTAVYAWIAPDGTVYDSGGYHGDWVRDNAEWLAKTYRLDIADISVGRGDVERNAFLGATADRPWVAMFSPNLGYVWRWNEQTQNALIEYVSANKRAYEGGDGEDVIEFEEISTGKRLDISAPRDILGIEASLVEAKLSRAELEAQGYTFKGEMAPDRGSPYGPRGHVYAYYIDLEGRPDPVSIASLSFEGPVYGDYVFPLLVRVQDQHKRKGIATILYDIAEEISGRRMEPSDDLSDEAKALWQDRLQDQPEVAKRLSSWVSVKASGEKHPWACLMVDYPAELAERVLAWTAENVHEESLYQDPEDSTGYGRESHIHTTVAYGLDPEMDRQRIADIVAAIDKPVKVRLGRISKFEPEKYDVIKIEVESPDLHALHEVVKALGVPGETYPDYDPHLTLAYVEKGAADDLLGQAPFEGEEFELTSFDYSAPPATGEKDKHTKYEIGTKVEAGGGEGTMWISPSGEVYRFSTNMEHAYVLWDIAPEVVKKKLAEYRLKNDPYDKVPADNARPESIKYFVNMHHGGFLAAAFRAGWSRVRLTDDHDILFVYTFSDPVKVLSEIPQEARFVKQLVMDTKFKRADDVDTVDVLEGEDALDAWKHRKDIRHRVAASARPTKAFMMSPEGELLMGWAHNDIANNYFEDNGLEQQLYQWLQKNQTPIGESEDIWETEAAINLMFEEGWVRGAMDSGDLILHNPKVEFDVEFALSKVPAEYLFAKKLIVDNAGTVTEVTILEGEDALDAWKHRKDVRHRVRAASGESKFWITLDGEFFDFPASTEHVSFLPDSYIDDNEDEGDVGAVADAVRDGWVRGNIDGNNLYLTALDLPKVEWALNKIPQTLKFISSLTVETADGGTYQVPILEGEDALDAWRHRKDIRHRVAAMRENTNKMWISPEGKIESWTWDQSMHHADKLEELTGFRDLGTAKESGWCRVTVGKNRSGKSELYLDAKDDARVVEALGILEDKYPEVVGLTVSTDTFTVVNVEEGESLSQAWRHRNDIRHRIAAAYEDEGFTEDGYWGQSASGILYQSADGKVLLLKRSADVEEPGTWGIPGGAIPVDDISGQPRDALESALTEAGEEMGGRPEATISGSSVFRDGDFTFTTFFGRTADTSFKPTNLGWESTDWGWFGADELPSPLHPGVAKTLGGLGVAAAFADWPNRWVHYTDIHKIGVNPKTQWTDPAGVYLFPESADLKDISVMWKQKKHRYVVEFTGDKVFDLSTLKYEDAVAIIKGLGSNEEAEALGYMEKNHGKDKKPGYGGFAWQDTFYDYLKRHFGVGRGGKQKTGEFNRFLRDMGYDAIWDETGAIHVAEKNQLVVLNVSKIKVLDVDKGERTDSDFAEVQAVVDHVVGILEKYGKTEAGQLKKKVIRSNDSTRLEAEIVVRPTDLAHLDSGNVFRFDVGSEYGEDEIDVSTSSGADYFSDRLDKDEMNLQYLDLRLNEYMVKRIKGLVDAEAARQPEAVAAGLTTDQAREAIAMAIGEASVSAWETVGEGVFQTEKMTDILDRTIDQLGRWGAFDAYARENFGVPLRAHRVFAGADLVFTDRYQALGIPAPDPKTCCPGQCEGTGMVPISSDETDPEFLTLWEDAEALEPSEDGWHFVKCPTCSGTGMTVKADLGAFEFKEEYDDGMKFWVNPQRTLISVPEGEGTHVEYLLEMLEDKGLFYKAMKDSSLGISDDDIEAYRADDPNDIGVIWDAAFEWAYENGWVRVWNVNNELIIDGQDDGQVKRALQDIAKDDSSLLFVETLVVGDQTIAVDEGEDAQTAWDHRNSVRKRVVASGFGFYDIVYSENFYENWKRDHSDGINHFIDAFGSDDPSEEEREAKAKELFDQEAYRVEEEIGHLFQAGKVDVWRMIQVHNENMAEFLLGLSNEQVVGEYSGIGPYWAYNPESAVAHWGGGGKDVRLHGQVGTADVDWEATVDAQMDPDIGDAEDEIRLKSGVPVSIIGINIDGKEKKMEHPVVLEASLRVKADGYWVQPDGEVINTFENNETGEHGDALPDIFDGETTADRVRQAIESGWARVLVNDQEVNIDMKDPEAEVPRVLKALDKINQLAQSQRMLYVDNADVQEIPIDDDETALQAWNHRHSIRKRVKAAKADPVTETDEFKAWFEGSAIVDASGNPLLLKHGTDVSKIERFEGDPESPVPGLMFFTTSSKTARSYGPISYTVALKITNPMVYDAQGQSYAQLQDGPDDTSPFWLAQEAKSEGYDGLVVKNIKDDTTYKHAGDTYVVWNPDQVWKIEEKGKGGVPADVRRKANEEFRTEMAELTKTREAEAAKIKEAWLKTPEGQKYSNRTASLAARQTGIRFWVSPDGDFESWESDTAADPWDEYGETSHGFVLYSVFPDFEEAHGAEIDEDEGTDVAHIAIRHGYTRGIFANGELDIELGAGKTADWVMSKLPPEYLFAKTLTVNNDQVPILEGEDALDAWKHRKDVRHRVTAATKEKAGWVSPEGEFTHFPSGKEHGDYLNKEVVSQWGGGDDSGEDARLAVKHGWARVRVMDKNLWIDVKNEDEQVPFVLKHLPKDWLFVEEIGLNGRIVPVLEGEDALDAWTRRKDIRHRVKASGNSNFWFNIKTGKLIPCGLHYDEERVMSKYDYAEDDPWGGVQMAMEDGWARGYKSGDELGLTVAGEYSGSIEKILAKLPSEFLFVKNLFVDFDNFQPLEGMASKSDDSFNEPIDAIPVLEGEDALDAWKHRKDVRHRVRAASSGKFWIAPNGVVFPVAGDHQDWVDTHYDDWKKFDTGQLKKKLDKVYRDNDDEAVRESLLYEPPFIDAGFIRVDGDALVGGPESLERMKAFVREYFIKTDRERPIYVSLGATGFEGSAIKFMRWDGKGYVTASANGNLLWISPDGVVHPVDKGTHGQWALANDPAGLIAGVVEPVRALYAYLSAGWTRINYAADQNELIVVADSPGKLERALNTIPKEWLFVSGISGGIYTDATGTQEFWVPVLEGEDALDAWRHRKDVRHRVAASFSQMGEPKAWVNRSGDVVPVTKYDHHAHEVRNILNRAGIDPDSLPDEDAEWAKVEELGWRRASFAVQGERLIVSAQEAEVEELLAALLKAFPEWSFPKLVITENEEVSVADDESALDAWRHRKDVRHRVKAANQFDRLYKEANDLAQQDAKYSGALENPALAQEQGGFQQAVKDARSEAELQQAWTRFQPSVGWDALLQMAGEEKAVEPALV